MFIFLLSMKAYEGGLTLYQIMLIFASPLRCAVAKGRLYYILLGLLVPRRVKYMHAYGTC
jgi:hypothetical protein